MGTSRSPRAEDGGLRRSALGRRRRWPVRAGIAAALVAGAFAVTASPAFHAQTIEVTGNHHLSRAAVLRLAGIRSGTNVLWLRTSAVADRIESDPWVAGASVTTSLPTTIRIEVRERRPAVEVRLGGARWLLVAGDGTVLVAVASDPHLPIVVGVAPPPIGSRPAIVTGPASAIGVMASTLRARVVTVTVHRDGSLSLVLQGGAVVRYGAPRDLRQKAETLAAVLRWASARRKVLGVIDLRAPLSPSVRLAGSSSPVTPSLSG